MLRAEGMHKLADELVTKFREEQAKKRLASDRISIESERWLSKFITLDEDMRMLKDYVRKLVNREHSVLIIGESGTGKELIARALHGDRSLINKEDDGQFIAVNCAGLPEELVESELFGYVKGAFTGADRESVGLIRRAEKGTLFLDEVGDLPLDSQAKLLRFLQEKKVRRIGDYREVNVDVRVVAATHHNLIELVNAGKFRLDLYARLSTFTLVTKPLRDRRSDIELIVKDMDISGNDCWGKVFMGDVEVYKGTTELVSKEADELEGRETEIKKFWEVVPLMLNVRVLQKIVAQFTVLGKVIG